MLEELLKKRATAHQKMQDILALAQKEDRSLTEDELNSYDNLEQEYDSLTAQIQRVERAAKREQDLKAPQRGFVGGGDAAGEYQKQKENEQRENPADIPVDKKRYSLFRAIKAQVTGNWDGAEYERECSLAIAEKLGRDAQGVFVPYSIQRDVMATKTGTGFTDDGSLVAEDHLDDQFIEALQADSIVTKLGAQILPGLVGDVDIPRALGGVDFTWVDEDGEANESNATYDSVKLTPKTISGAVPITRRLLKQSSPAVEALIDSDIRKGIALAIDKAVLSGDGASNNPKGIIATTGVLTQAVADADGVPTFTEAVSFETKLAEENALRGKLSYVTTPTISGLTKTKPIDAGSGIMLNVNNQINGYPVSGTTLMPAGKTLFGNFEDVIIGMWGVMDISVDKAAKAASGGVVLRVFQDIDVAVRHPQSFCVTA